MVVFKTKGDYTGPLRVGSLSAFGGTAWMVATSDRIPYEPGSVVGGAYSQPDPGDILICPEEPASPEDCWWEWETPPFPDTSQIPAGWSESGTVDVQVANLSGYTFATGSGPRALTMTEPGANMDYDWDQDSLSLERSFVPGDLYQVRTWTLGRSAIPQDFRPWNWEGAGTDAGGLPIAHSAELRDLTLGVIGDATTQDAILTAIQAYLRASPFRYTLHPMWHSTGDPVWDFLTYKEGYCVQYATAMALMGMSVGIQMRVSVGYLPGAIGADGWRTVTGAQAHMWPEAYFGETGWVAYEPTPSVDAAVVLHNTPGPSGTSATPSAPQTTRPTASPTARPTTGPGANNPTGPDWGSPVPWLTAGGIGAAILLAALAGWLYVSSYTPERAWRSIRRRGLRAGVLTDSMSVRTAVATLVRRDPAAAGRLGELRDHLERARYGPAGEELSAIPGRDLWRLRTRIRRGLGAVGQPVPDGGVPDQVAAT